MKPALEVAVVEQTDAAEARRVALRLAAELGFDETAQGKLALVVTEIGTNLVKHAGGGRVLLSPVYNAEYEGLDVLGLDRGPGMANLAECLRDGYSTAGSPGTGLGAIVRLSLDSDFYTTSGRGTVVRARCPARSGHQHRSGSHSGIDVGGIVLPLAGFSESGDAWHSRSTRDGIVILMVDGLGHGPVAADAARTAVKAFSSLPHENSLPLFEGVHQALGSTRGAAAAIAEINTVSGELSFVGVGNISASIVGESGTQHLVSMNGIVGHRTQTLRQFKYVWTPGSTLIMHSDGVRTRWRFTDYQGLQWKSPVTIAGVILRDESRGTDDAAVVVAHRKGAHYEA
jgi:anti-sigma regulatory factor (Ser/Thr protein kinase)